MFLKRDKTLQDRHFFKTEGSYLNVVLQSDNDKHKSCKAHTEYNLRWW